MPIYEYRCANCGTVFEEFVRSDKEPELRCPICGSSEAKKTFSLFGTRNASVGTSSAQSSAAASCAPSG